MTFALDDPAAYPGPIETVRNRLGWTRAFRQVDFREVEGFADFARAVVLGMGGSSLAAEVSARWFGLPREGGLAVEVLDTSNPCEVATMLARADEETLFLVSSKSGTTIETASLAAAARARLTKAGLSAEKHMVVVTDPGTPLASEAARRVFLAPSDVGGRFSAHTVYHLVPFALGGGDVEGFLASARAAWEGRERGIELGRFLAESAKAGRDKVYLATSPGAAPLVPWIQQLVAESTGKGGKGLYPIPADFLPRSGAEDGICVRIAREGEKAPEVGGLETFEIEVASGDLGGEFLRWMIATAYCGAQLGVNPFDEPDVALAKEKSKARLASPVEAPRSADPARAAQALAGLIEGPAPVGPAPVGPAPVGPAPVGLAPPRYLVLLAFLPRTKEVKTALEELRAALAARAKGLVSFEFGPRYLHSTGQFHKGGPNEGRFAVLVHGPFAEDPEVPGRGITFGRLLRAQAMGDAEALAERGRPVEVVETGAEPAVFLREVVSSL